ncbi:MCE family protein, partial [Escherichia coli]
DAKGIRVILDSKKAGQLSPGDPVLFRGYRVGSVETSTFDTQKAVDLTSAGMRVEMGSLTTLLSGGVSFDVPEGLDLGQPVAPKT